MIPQIAMNNRWTPRRKVAILEMIAAGVLAFYDARQQYNLSEEELQSWTRHYEAHGLEGLKVTKKPPIHS